MTRELTEADLRVERDRLLEGGRTPEQVERMQAVAPGFVFVVEEHVSWEGETLIAVCPAETKAREVAERWFREMHAESGEPELSFAWSEQRGRWVADAQRCEFWISRMPFPPPEKQQGASTRRPQEEPQPDWCPNCRRDIRRMECICDNFPGSGAG